MHADDGEEAYRLDGEETTAQPLEPKQYTVCLPNGYKVEIWADGAYEQDGRLVFFRNVMVAVERQREVGMGTWPFRRAAIVTSTEWDEDIEVVAEFAAGQWAHYYLVSDENYGGLP